MKRWPQTHWLYWNGPNIIDWVECYAGFKIDASTKEWRVSQLYFDSWIIISFTILVLLMTILSDHDVNASYFLLESITYNWMLFLIFENKEWKIKQYFDQILVVITHLNSLIFPFLKSAFIIDGDAFILNWASCIVIILIFAISQSIKNENSRWSNILFIIRTQTFSKYINWASTYIWFWVFYELFQFNEVINSMVLSYILTAFLFLIFALFTNWFIIYSKETWCVWIRYPRISKIRQEFWLIDRIDSKDYILAVRYILAKKLVFSLTVVIQIQIRLSSMIFTFLIISFQIMYLNIMIGLCHFKSSITRGLFILNEFMMIFEILLISVDYLNESFDSNSNIYDLNSLWFILVRIHILFIISIELFRMILFIIAKIISCAKSWRFL